MLYIIYIIYIIYIYIYIHIYVCILSTYNSIIHCVHPHPFSKGDRESSKSFLNGEGVIIDKGIKRGISIVTSVFTF